MKCCICKKEIENENGNNAQPVKKGRCCNDCNTKIVLRKRIEIMQTQKRGLDKK